MDRLQIKVRLLSSVLCLSLAAPLPIAAAAQSWAQEITARSAQQLQASGDYKAAIPAGRAEATVEGLVAAAKAGLYLAAYEEKNKKTARKLLAAATLDAEAAVALDKNHIDANLQLTIAQGYAARIKTSPKRAKQARERAEWLVQQAPSNGYVLGLLGGWHGEAVAAYGAFIAGVAVGADKALFEEYFDKAVDAAPNNPLITAYYVRLLLDIDGDGMREKAERLLLEIETAQTADAFEAIMKERALALKTALASGEAKELKRLIKAQRPFRGQK